jgi:septum formation protein
LKTWPGRPPRTPRPSSISRKNMAYPLIHKAYPLILASSSPRRRELLTQIQIPFRVVASDVDEQETGDEPAKMCLGLAEKKAIQVHRLAGPTWVLGADTIVVVEGKILGKPHDEVDAREMLTLLAGTGHRVITGFCVIDPSGLPAHSEAVSTDVRFKPLSDREIEAYVCTGEPFGKAGAYAIQGIGAFMVESICGSYSNVVGLPVCALIKALIRVGAIETFPLTPSSQTMSIFC